MVQATNEAQKQAGKNEIPNAEEQKEAEASPTRSGENKMRCGVVQSRVRAEQRGVESLQELLFQSHRHLQLHRHGTHATRESTSLHLRVFSTQ